MKAMNALIVRATSFQLFGKEELMLLALKNQILQKKWELKKTESMLLSAGDSYEVIKKR